MSLDLDHLGRRAQYLLSCQRLGRQCGMGEGVYQAPESWCASCQVRIGVVEPLLAEVSRLRAATVAAPVVGVATDGPAGDRAGYEGGAA